MMHQSSDPSVDAPSQLRSTQEAPTGLAGSSTPVAVFRWSDRFQKIPEAQKIFFTQNLRVMIHAGLPLSRALLTLAEQIDHRFFHKVIMSIQHDVDSGVALSAAFGKFKRVFSELFISMIEAGETSGKLDEALGRLTIQMRKDHTIKAKIRNALIYPTVVVIGMVVVAIIMMTVVIPKITQTLTETGQKLPLPTRVLVFMSNLLIHHGLILALGLAGVSAVLITINRQPQGKLFFHRLALRTPILGPIIRKISLASFTRSFSSLLATDIPIVETFRVIARTLSNVVYRQALIAGADQLKTGLSVVKTLEQYPALFPPLVTQIFAIGEESGTLDEVSGEIATFLEEEVDQTMANLSTILEPAIILVLGLGVAAIALAVILPIYSLSSGNGG